MLDELHTLLYKRMAEEQDRHRAWLVGLPPEEILNYAYGYCVRLDILIAIQDMDLAEEQLLALLDSPTPLEDVVRCVYRVETNEMDVIMDCIEILADDRLRQRDTANRRN